VAGGLNIGDVETVATCVVAELGAQDAKTIINSDDKKIVLRKFIS
jgi:hypothetical protein